jgi:hypothetical protein
LIESIQLLLEESSVIKRDQDWLLRMIDVQYKRAEAIVEGGLEGHAGVTQAISRRLAILL